MFKTVKYFIELNKTKLYFIGHINDSTEVNLTSNANKASLYPYNQVDLAIICNYLNIKHGSINAKIDYEVI